MFGPLPNLPEIEIVKVKNCTFNLITSKIIYRFYNRNKNIFFVLIKLLNQIISSVIKGDQHDPHKLH